MSRKERHFQGIAREIRNFSFFLISEQFFVSNNFVSEGSGLKVSAVVFYYRRSEFTTESKFTIRSDFSLENPKGGLQTGA